MYNLMAAVGLLLALLIFLRREKILSVSGKLEDKLNGTLIVSAVFGFIMSNVANWFLFPEFLSYPLLERVSSAGLSFYYGMLGFLALYIALLKAQKVDWRFWTNELVPSILIFHAFGRIGCSLAGCCYGRDLIPPIEFWGIHLHLFPARELEALCLFVMFYIFQFKIRRCRLPLYLLCYSVLRFFLEFGRGDARGVFFVRALSPAQITSVIIWIGLAIWILRKNSRL